MESHDQEVPESPKEKTSHGSMAPPRNTGDDGVCFLPNSGDDLPNSGKVTTILISFMVYGKAWNGHLANFRVRSVLTSDFF